MWNIVVKLQFNDFRVNHNQFDISRWAVVQNRKDDWVYADRFTCACSSRNQQMRRFCDVDNLWLAGNVFSQNDRNCHLLEFGERLLDNLAERDDCPLFVRDFDTDSVFSWNRSDDTHWFCSQSEGNVVLQVDDFAQFYARSGEQLEHGDDRAFSDSGDFCLDAEFIQGLLEIFAGLFGFVVDSPVFVVFKFFQQICGDFVLA